MTTIAPSKTHNRQRAEFKCLLLLVVIATALPACTVSYDWFWKMRARAARLQNDYSRATQVYLGVVRDNPNGKSSLEAAREGAPIALLSAKDYLAAIELLRIIANRADDFAEQKNAQQLIAQTYFEHLQDYGNAIVELERLLKLPLNGEEKYQFRLELAKSYLNTNNLQQCVAEIDTIETKKLRPEQRYEMKMFKASALIAMKQMANAAAIWESIIVEFPERANIDHLPLNLARAYEDLNELDKAIEILKSMNYSDQAFIQQQIKHLQEKRANLPGARGWHK